MELDRNKRITMPKSARLLSIITLNKITLKIDGYTDNAYTAGTAVSEVTACGKDYQQGRKLFFVCVSRYLLGPIQPVRTGESFS
jgi:hypothetical protein